MRTKITHHRLHLRFSVSHPPSHRTHSTHSSLSSISSSQSPIDLNLPSPPSISVSIALKSNPTHRLVIKDTHRSCLNVCFNWVANRFIEWGANRLKVNTLGEMEIIKTGEKSSSSSSSNDISFECKICLELADQDPIVTRCGHLFCWPCLRRWLSIGNKPHCPVCKSLIKEKKLIPIDVIGKISLYSDARRVEIPNRPSLRSSFSNRVSSSFRRTRNAIAAALNGNRHRLSRPRRYMPMVALGSVGLVVLGLFSAAYALTDLGDSSTGRFPEAMVPLCESVEERNDGWGKVESNYWSFGLVLYCLL